jgi:RES domain-containing protein
VILWRISRHLDLSGTGGLRLPGRWHHVGHPVVYLATSPAAALLEVCVHTSANDVPPSFTLLRVEAPEDLSISEIDPATLPPDWPSRQDLTRDLGTKWLQGRSSALLRVPSAIVPDTVNVLFNPLHPQAAMCTIVGSSAYPFDLRIKK